MARFAAFLRGISPTNASMPELRRAFETAGFTDVSTVLGTGNVVFSTRMRANASIERRAERAMQAELDRTFLTIVRPVEYLTRLLDSDPFAAFNLKSGTKRIVTFLREPTDITLSLPLSLGQARIHSLVGMEIFSSYVPSGNGAEFMRLIEQNYGKALTTRTLLTVERVVKAGGE